MTVGKRDTAGRNSHSLVRPVSQSAFGHLPCPQLGMKLVRIVSVRLDYFSDSDSFGQNYLEILGFRNEFGYFFLGNENEYSMGTIRWNRKTVGNYPQTLSKL